MDPLSSLLTPQPQTLEQRSETWRWPSRATVWSGPDVSTDVSDGLLRVLERGGWAVRAGQEGALIRLSVDPTVARAQGYRLHMGVDGVRIVGADNAGLWYGVLTLAQVLRLTPDVAAIPSLTITDWPDIARRGVMLDISRDKVPTMETLRGIVELLSELKFNEFQLYMEHTFAYQGHEEVWAEASPMTPDEIRSLDAFCRARQIQLVPNQNSFGHMHRWLVHDRYRPMSEVPEGIDHPFSDVAEPFGLCPVDPASLAFLRDLYDQLLPCFSATTLNVGCDETIDLGLGRSASACATRGKTTVYVEFLTAIHAELAARGHRMQFWGDIILKDPERIGELPDDATALLWGYEADHPFDLQASQFQRAGLPFYICPGTSSWNSLLGRTDNALGNLSGACLAARDHGADGVLVTDWGDYGHLQPLPVSYLGWMVGSAYAWNVNQAERGDPVSVWADRLDAHVFLDRSGLMGRAVLALGNLYQSSGLRSFNGSGLFWLLLYPHGLKPHHWPEEITAEGFEEVLACLSQLEASISETEMAREDASWICDEFRWASDLTALAARIGIARLSLSSGASLASLSPEDRAPLQGALAPLLDGHSRIWSRRNRAGGCVASARRLEKLRAALKGLTD